MLGEESCLVPALLAVFWQLDVPELGRELCLLFGRGLCQLLGGEMGQCLVDSCANAW